MFPPQPVTPVPLNPNNDKIPISTQTLCQVDPQGYFMFDFDV